jgi:hypothetical protein
MGLYLNNLKKGGRLVIFPYLNVRQTQCEKQCVSIPTGTNTVKIASFDQNDRIGP